jgi:hypothetical protein
MPRATAQISDLVHKDLNTLPEGYVKLRRMTYGQKLQRQQMAMKMMMSGDSKTKEMQGEMAFVNAYATAWSFGVCVAEHNLEDENGKSLDMNNMKDVQRLDPRVGEEIDTYINELNNYEEQQTEEGN